jgi:hypothetical protein
VEIQQAEISGKTELAIAKLEADDALFEAQTAGMTPEQKAEYISLAKENLEVGCIKHSIAKVIRGSLIPCC